MASYTSRRKGGKRTVGKTVKRAEEGELQRLERYALRAHHLKAEGYYIHEIGAILTDEFKLPRVPPVSTIWNWIAKASKAYMDEIDKLKMAEFMEAYDQIKEVIAKFLPIATAGKLEIQRWARIDGEMQPFMDEKAFDEQAKAAMVVLKWHERLAKLLGLDLDKKLEEKGGEMPTLAELHMWVIGKVNDTIKPINPNVKELPTLELRSGNEAIDRMEGAA